MNDYEPDAETESPLLFDTPRSSLLEPTASLSKALTASASAIRDDSATVDQIEAWFDNPMRCTSGEIAEKAVRMLIREIRQTRKNLSAAELCVDAVNEIRTRLLQNDVPVASYVDDHVGNAIVQRNQARDLLSSVRSRIMHIRTDSWDVNALIEKVSNEIAEHLGIDPEEEE